MVRIYWDRSDDPQPEQSGLSCNDDQLALRSVYSDSGIKSAQKVLFNVWCWCLSMFSGTIMMSGCGILTNGKGTRREYCEFSLDELQVTFLLSHTHPAHSKCVICCCCCCLSVGRGSYRVDEESQWCFTLLHQWHRSRWATLPYSLWYSSIWNTLLFRATQKWCRIQSEE